MHAHTAEQGTLATSWHCRYVLLHFRSGAYAGEGRTPQKANVKKFHFFRTKYEAHAHLPTEMASSFFQSFPFAQVP